MNVHGILDILINSLLPLIWASIGPVVSVAVTASVNSVVGTYVPRPVQLILAAIAGAVTAGLTGSTEGIDPNVAAGMGGAASFGTQLGIMLNSKRFLASAPETKVVTS